jgi:hypothetical protein
MRYTTLLLATVASPLVSGAALAEPTVLPSSVLDAVTAGAVPDDAPGATDNVKWGMATKGFAQTGTLGEHSSSPPGTEPGDGREGVGNVSKDGFGDLSDGAQGRHAEAVAPGAGVTISLPPSR